MVVMTTKYLEFLGSFVKKNIISVIFIKKLTCMTTDTYTLQVTCISKTTMKVGVNTKAKKTTVEPCHRSAARGIS